MMYGADKLTVLGGGHKVMRQILSAQKSRKNSLPLAMTTFDHLMAHAVSSLTAAITSKQVPQFAFLVSLMTVVCPAHSPQKVY